MTIPAKTDRAESAVQVLILLFVAGMAGAASFTHVHDWTMRNAPHGTGSWLGWANAVITELVPAAAGIEVRRRKKQHRPVTYPMAVLITDAAVSLAAQLSDAVHTLGGALAFALPALAFLALTKLVLSRTTANTGDPSCPTPAPNPDAHGPATGSGTHPPAGGTGPKTSAPPADGPTSTRTAAPAAPAPAPDHPDPQPVPSGQLLISARMTAFAHQQATGRPITPGELAERIAIPADLAASLLDHIGGIIPPPVTAAVNGTPVAPGGQP
jgi:hypothetical protein